MNLSAYGPAAWLATELDEPWEWAAGVRQAVIPGVVDVQVGPDSAVVFCEPDRATQIEARLRAIREDKVPVAIRPVDLHIVYDPDRLASLGSALGLDADAIVFRHTAATYRVLFVAERPGCPFLGPLDRSLQPSPDSQAEERQPAGTVLLRHGLCSVTTVDTVIDGHPLGRILETIWSTSASPMATLRPGQHVRFVAS